MMNRFAANPGKLAGTLGLILTAALSACGGGSGPTSSAVDGSPGATLATLVTSTTPTEKAALATSTTPNAKLATSTSISPVKVLPVASTIQSLGLLGGNLPGISDWGNTHPFVDLMKQARKLGTAAAPWDGSAILGNDGWPIADFGVTLMTGQSPVTGIAGIYKFSFTGKADIATTGTSASIQNVLYDSVLKKTTGEINFPVGEAQLFLVFKNTNGSVKNLKIIHPGYSLDNTPIFRTEFLNHIKRVQQLRFMEWTSTNNNVTTSWAGRANPATIHDAHLGVSWEDIIALGNETGKAIWINVPAQANDDYVRNLAQLLNTTIKPGIQVYIEYSNELWNGGFQQFGYNSAAARAEIIANPASPLNYDKGGDDWGFRRTANRTKQISDIFRSIVGDAKMMSIYRPILAGQIVNPYVLQTGLSMIQSVFGAPNQYFYGLAGAPYFNLGTLQTQVGLSTTQVLDALAQTAIATPKEAHYESNGALAAWYGLAFLAYEAGADTFGPGSLDAKEAANKDPRIQAINENFLTNWYQAGFSTLNLYTLGADTWATQYGTWALTYDLNVNTPKIASLDSTNAKAVPAIATRHMVPGTWDAREQPDQFPPYANPYLRWVHQPSYCEFMFNADKAGSYILTLKGGAENSNNGGNTVKIALNNSTIVAAFGMTTTANYELVPQAPITMQLKKGINVLRFSSAQPVDSWYLGEISIK